MNTPNPAAFMADLKSLCERHGIYISVGGYECESDLVDGDGKTLGYPDYDKYTFEPYEPTDTNPTPRPWEYGVIIDASGQTYRYPIGARPPEGYRLHAKEVFGYEDRPIMQPPSVGIAKFSELFHQHYVNGVREHLNTPNPFESIFRSGSGVRYARQVDLPANGDVKGADE